MNQQIFLKTGKSMKKIFIFTLMSILVMGFLTACGQDDVTKELLQYINTDTRGVNENSKKLAEELGKWISLADDQSAMAFIKNNILPVLNDSIDKLSKIDVKTPEVKNLRDMYMDSMKCYKEGFEILLQGAGNKSVDIVLRGNDKLKEANQKQNEYYEALKALAAQKNIVFNK